MSAPASSASLPRRISTWLHRHPRAQLGLLLSGPVGWLLIAYLGSLAALMVASIWQLDPFTAEIVREPSVGNFRTLVTQKAYLDITLRTVAIALLVTLTDALLAFPIAYYMSRVAAPRTRSLLVVGILMPLWASYLVKVYVWRTILGNEGLVNWALSPFGLRIPATGDTADLFRVWLVFSYLWLPYMILPIYAGLERIPNSLLEASGDLGAKALTTFRRVVLPLVLPAVVAGSIFTFSLTLGDYITPSLVSNSQFIGNAIFRDMGVANNLPLAAAFATVPVAIMIVYLLVARRMGAFEAL
ncbi:MAG TPA: ABC transporter permease [Candidatus Limnocylindrales bacterium]|nr:ABC transporter permease [Candidatus Limnocylindrales bacterium]